MIKKSRYDEKFKPLPRAFHAQLIRDERELLQSYSTSVDNSTRRRQLPLIYYQNNKMIFHSSSQHVSVSFFVLSFRTVCSLRPAFVLCCFCYGRFEMYCRFELAKIENSNFSKVEIAFEHKLFIF